MFYIFFVTSFFFFLSIYRQVVNGSFNHYVEAKEGGCISKYSYLSSLFYFDTEFEVGKGFSLKTFRLPYHQLLSIYLTHRHYNTNRIIM